MYAHSRILTKPLGNNAFAYREGRELFVPALCDGNFENVRIGEKLVFEEMEGDMLISAIGLESFVRTKWEGRDVYVFDNHNHAFAFWCDAVNRGVIQAGFELVHIDMHSDLWPNDHRFDISRIGDSAYIEQFVDEETNVGNYIAPAIASGLVRKVIRIEGEWDLDRTCLDNVESNSVLNLDLDFFAPDLDDVPFTKKRDAILRFARMSGVITIATSPYFIDQGIALRRMNEIFGV